MPTLLRDELPVPLSTLGDTYECTRQVTGPPSKQTHKESLQCRFGAQPRKNYACERGRCFRFGVVVRVVVHKIYR